MPTIRWAGKPPSSAARSAPAATTPIHRLPWIPSPTRRSTPSPGSEQTYTLDTLGNWTASATGAGTGTSTPPTLTPTTRTNNSQNELTAIGGASKTFDNNGNTLTGVGTYDAWNRLATASSGAPAYSYFPDGDVAVRTYSCTSSTTNSYYSTDMQVLEDDAIATGGGCGCCGPTTTVQSQYVWGLGYVNQMVERDDNSSSGSLGISGSGLGVRIYPEQDANYNVRTLTNTSGSVLEHFDYDPYGNAHILTSTYGTSGTSFGNDSHNWIYGFQGGRYDPISGLYKFGARNYSASIGRWVEQDPAGYVDGAGRYEFVGDRPAGALDPLGLSAHLRPWNGRILNRSSHDVQYEGDWLELTDPDGFVARPVSDWELAKESFNAAGRSGLGEQAWASIKEPTGFAVLKPGQDSNVLRDQKQTWIVDADFITYIPGVKNYYYNVESPEALMKPQDISKWTRPGTWGYKTDDVGYEKMTGEVVVQDAQCDKQGVVLKFRESR